MKTEESEINMFVYMRIWQALVGSSAKILPVTENTKWAYGSEWTHIGDLMIWQASKFTLS